MLDHNEIIAFNPKKARLAAFAALEKAKALEAQQIANGARWEKTFKGSSLHKT